MIVVDTNIISYLLIPNEKFNQIADELFKKDRLWIAPMLWHYELLSVLGVYLRNSMLDAKACKAVYSEAQETVESRGTCNFKDVFELIENSTLSAYDCEFVALASTLDLPLITEDKKILREFPNISFSIEGYLDQL